MRVITSYIIVLCACFSAFAQQNDTAVVRQNSVAEVLKYQYVHAFTKSNDTCLYELKKINANGQIAYNMQDYGCMGYRSKRETFYTFNKNGIEKVRFHLDELPEYETKYSYSQKEELPVASKSFHFKTNDSSSTTSVYFRKKRSVLIDSSFMKFVNQLGVESMNKNYVRYNKAGDKVQEYNKDQDDDFVNMVSYEYNDARQLVSLAHTTYGDKPKFQQTFYEYNQKGQLSKTYNTVNQKQVYFYHKNGLINNVLAYNPKGVLEIEYIFDYKFHK